MDRINDANATEDKKFRAPNSQAGIAATRVRATWLNNVQEELLAVIEAAGLTPDIEDETQLLQAIDILKENKSISKVIDNNKITFFDLPGISFDHTQCQGALIEAHVKRSDNSSEKHDFIKIELNYSTSLAKWTSKSSRSGSDAGVAFKVTDSGQIQYTSTSMDSGSHAGSVKLKIQRF